MRPRKVGPQKDRKAVHALVLDRLATVRQRVARFRRSRLVDSDDLAQEAALKLLRAAELYDPASGRPWDPLAEVWIKGAIIAALKTAARQTRDQVRMSDVLWVDREKRPGLEGEGCTVPIPAAPEVDPDAGEDLEILRAALALLDPRGRDLVLARAGGETFRSMARRWGIGRSNATRAWHAAMAKLPALWATACRRQRCVARRAWFEGHSTGGGSNGELRRELRG